MLIPGSEYDAPGEWADFAFRSLELYPEFVTRLTRQSGAEIDFRVCGSLTLAASEQEWQELRALARRQENAGRRNQLLTAGEVRKLLTFIGPQPVGGVYYPGDAQADPRTLMNALKIACLGLAVDLREHSPVKGIRLVGDWIEAEAAAAVFRAKRAVLAAGAWSSGVAISDRDRKVALPACYPVRGHLLGYWLKPESLPHIVRFRHTYLVQRRRGFTIAGTSEEKVGFDRTVDPVTCAGIATAAHALAPGLIPPSPDEAWIGFRPGIDQPGPALGRWPGTPLWLAYGHYRNGILLAPATAERIADGLMASLEKG
jgi:glycine/D-amino acid oxidase-like deaminating enzyme